MGCAVPLLVLLSCATTSRPVEPEPPRSSVDVLLRHAAQLKLSEAQRAELLAIDEKREGRAERLRVDFQQKRLDVGAGENDRRSSNRGPRDGVRALSLERRRTMRAMMVLDGEALRDAEALLDDEQRALGRTYLERYRLERVASAHEDGE